MRLNCIGTSWAARQLLLRPSTRHRYANQCQCMHFVAFSMARKKTLCNAVCNCCRDDPSQLHIETQSEETKEEDFFSMALQPQPDGGWGGVAINYSGCSFGGWLLTTLNYWLNYMNFAHTMCSTGSGQECCVSILGSHGNAASYRTQEWKWRQCGLQATKCWHPPISNQSQHTTPTPSLPR